MESKISLYSFWALTVLQKQRDVHFRFLINLGSFECLCNSGEETDCVRACVRVCENIINIDLVKCIHTVIREELWLLWC